MIAYSLTTKIGHSEQSVRSEESLFPGSRQAQTR